MICPHCGSEFIQTRFHPHSRSTELYYATAEVTNEFGLITCKNILDKFKDWSKQDAFQTAANLVRNKLWIRVATGKYKQATNVKMEMRHVILPWPIRKVEKDAIESYRYAGVHGGLAPVLYEL